MIITPLSPMNNRRRVGEYGSPHVGMPIKSDIIKIDALVRNIDTVGRTNHNRLDQTTETESRGDMGSSHVWSSAKTELVAGAHQSDDVGYQQHYSPSIPMMPQMLYPSSSKETSDKISAGLSQEGQTDAIFRERQAPTTTWSNVVNSNALPSSPLGMTTRSSSGETLLTSNISQFPTNFQHLGLAARSQSFEDETAPRNLLKSFSFGASSSVDANNYQQTSLGIPPSHPGLSSFKDSTLLLINQGATLQSSPRMYPSTPYQEFKQRPSMGNYSPNSLGGDSMNTDQTSPMSSPSLSPHVSPSMNSRKQHGEGPPPMWHLSDANEYHSEPSSPHHRLHSHLPQSIPEHHRHEPDNPAHYSHHHSYTTSHHGNNTRSGPTSPPRHLHSQSVGNHHHHHHHNSMYSRRPGPKPYGTGPPTSHTPLHHRSSMEVLKTLLRKKACLYEPETSLAVSLATWLVGRRLALSQGYFTRQQLQAGVHSCVGIKIKEGHVTRTKVNRCMQVILNSCFHYIIPRPDGSEECGEAFRIVFSREAADEDHLLGTLPPPWGGLTLLPITDEESHSSMFHDSDDDHHASSSGKTPGKESSSAASQAGDSLDSGKRSVLLCFNENIRSASDVFRCHNEFIRDVAHTGNLSLSSEDWKSFFLGTNAHRKRSASVESFQSGYFHLADMHDRMDQQGLSKLRTSWCAKRYDHDHAFCAFAHVDTNRGWLRRDPFVHSYTPMMCPYIKPLPGAKDCFVNMCPLGVECNHSHSKEEILYHPESYKKQPCRMPPGSCPLGDICPNTHAELPSPHQQPHGYSRQGKRHHHDHSPYHRSSHAGPKRRVSTTSGHTTGFGKLPDGSPMLYIDPAPLSEFEKTLLLPGLQAMFRDHSSSIFYSTMNKISPYEYGPFGYRSTQPKRASGLSSIQPIGRSMNE